MKTATSHKDDIDVLLTQLPKDKLVEVKDFIEYLIEKDRKHRAFVERVLKAEQEPTAVYESVEDFMQAVQEEIDEMED